MIRFKKKNKHKTNIQKKKKKDRINQHWGLKLKKHEPMSFHLNNTSYSHKNGMEGTVMHSRLIKRVYNLSKIKLKRKKTQKPETY